MYANFIPFFFGDDLDWGSIPMGCKKEKAKKGNVMPLPPPPQKKKKKKKSTAIILISW